MRIGRSSAGIFASHTTSVDALSARLGQSLIAAILKKQGPEGVFAEISQIPGDYVKAIYFKKLLAHRELGAPVVERDERASLLVEIAGQYALSGAPRDAYLEAARSIPSEYERQRAQAALVEREGR